MATKEAADLETSRKELRVAEAANAVITSGLQAKAAALSSLRGDHARLQEQLATLVENGVDEEVCVLVAPFGVSQSLLSGESVELDLGKWSVAQLQQACKHLAALHTCNTAAASVNAVEPGGTVDMAAAPINSVKPGGTVNTAAAPVNAVEPGGTANTAAAPVNAVEPGGTANTAAAPVNAIEPGGTANTAAAAVNVVEPGGTANTAAAPVNAVEPGGTVDTAAAPSDAVIEAGGSVNESVTAAAAVDAIIEPEGTGKLLVSASAGARQKKPALSAGKAGRQSQLRASFDIFNKGKDRIICFSDSSQFAWCLDGGVCVAYARATDCKWISVGSVVEVSCFLVASWYSGGYLTRWHVKSRWSLGSSLLIQRSMSMLWTRMGRKVTLDILLLRPPMLSSKVAALWFRRGWKTSASRWP